MAKPFFRLLFALVCAACAPAFAVEVGQPAPSVAFKPLADSSVPPTLAALKGKVVYVDFWASWCTPCLRSMPALRTLYGSHKDQGFVVVGVNKDVSAAEAERFLRRFPVSFPLAADADDAIAKAFDVKTMPSGYLVDRSGVVRQVLRGFTAETEVELAKQIQVLLEARP